MNLVPMPHAVRKLSGQCNLKGCVARVGVATSAVRHKLGELGFRVQEDAALLANQVIIGRADSAGVPAPYRPEGYALVASGRGAAIIGHDADGLFWGLTTLQQLLNGSKHCPAVRIADWPAFEFRMHHDDISRKQVSTLADFKRIIRLLSYFKVKYYTPYMEDMLYLKSYPDIGKTRGRLMPDEVREMLRYAKLCNVTVFPTYSLIGHQENLLANPKYRKYAYEVFQLPSAYDITKPILRPYLKKVIRDVCELFPDAPIFHGCFDEVIGPMRKQLIDHANWCAAEVAKYGKRLMMWVDMFKNHYGLEMLHSLDGRVMPVEWNYGDPFEQERKYVKAGVIPWGLAGYNSWCCFLPDFATGKKNLDRWAEVMSRWGGPGFGSSQWGDNGYENSRDLCWNLFAYNGEAAWTGGPAKPRFEERFQSAFYGRTIKPLLNVVAAASKRANPPGKYWRYFRMTMPAMIRLAATQPDVIRKAGSDTRLLERSLKDVSAARRKAVREAGHMDHFAVAIERELNVCRRLLLADKIAAGLSGPALRRALDAELVDLMRVKKLYEKVWLRQFKRPNIEVSLAVYDEVAESLRLFGRPAGQAAKNYTCLDIEPICTACMVETGGIPLGQAAVDGVPFRFAGQKYTHAQLDEGRRFTLRFEPTKVRDIHLVYGAQTIVKDPQKAKPVLEVRLLRAGKVVFREKLLSIRHLCDWWAPLGEHIWAGGGYRHVDRRRVSYAIKPGQNFGLMHLKNFGVAGRQADCLEIESLSAEKFFLYAATIERKGR